MVAGIETPIWTRKEWQTKRDAEKVPSGATKANIGAALDKFHKANAKSMVDGGKAAKELQTALQAYKLGAAKKYPKWVARIDKVLLPLVDTYLESLQKLQAAQKAYPALHDKAMQETEKLGKEFMQWQKAGGNGTFRPSNPKPLVALLNQYVQVLYFAPQLTPKVTAKMCQAYALTIEHASTGAWTESNVGGLVKFMSQFPTKI